MGRGKSDRAEMALQNIGFVGLQNTRLKNGKYEVKERADWKPTDGRIVLYLSFKPNPC